MEFILRPYQEEAVKAGYTSLIYGGYKKASIIVVSQGGGKSIIIANIAKKLDGNVLVLQPTKEILEANYSKIISYGVEDVKIFSASVGKKEIGKITYATIGSIWKKPELFMDVKYILFDECHLYNSKSDESMYNSFIKTIGNPRALGLTGTPYRNVGKYLNERVIRHGKEVTEKYYTTSLTTINRIYPFFFGNVAYTIQTKELMDMGWLTKPEYDTSYSKDFDYSRLKMNTTGADFDADALEAFVNQPNRVKSVVSACHEYSSKVRSNLIFCSSIKQAETIAKQLKSTGLDGEVLSSKSSKKERESLLKRFASGELKHLLNVGVLIVGYDYPALDCITWARPTISVNLWTQGVGRCFRLDPNNPNKKAYVVDVAGVSLNLGRAETIRVDKEEGGYRSIVVSEVGELSGEPLSKFKMKDKQKQELF